jgi:hypothetical protein
MDGMRIENGGWNVGVGEAFSLQTEECDLMVFGVVRGGCIFDKHQQ